MSSRPPRSAPSVAAAPCWGELVFHVLAHVPPPGPLPASAHDPAYCAWVAQRLGAASNRELGGDVERLAPLLNSHDKLARVHRLAWLFEDRERAQRSAERDLRSLRASDVDRPELLTALLEDEGEVEVLRCAALLEAQHVQALERVTLEPERLQHALSAMLAVAPGLVGKRIRCLRPLGLRGRAFADEIWIGTPFDAPGPDLEHACWQAAHEATVLEALQIARTHGLAIAEREVERVALCAMTSRAVAAGEQAAHERFCATWSVTAAQRSPAQLRDRGRDVLRRLLG